MHRTQAVSGERMNPVIERAATDSSGRASRAGAYPSNPMPQAQGTYTSPSPPPPAPAPAPAVPVPGLPAHTGYHSLGNRNVPAQVAPLATWPGVHGASMDTNIIYSLERIHAATLALCNFCNEHLDSQAVPRVEQLYAFTGTAQDINQELRSLIAIQEGRPARDFPEAAPYYPWVAGGAAQPYWVPGRDERDMKGMRTDDVHEDKQASVHGRRRSPSQKAESMNARSLRHTSNVDELGYVPRADADLAGTSGIRAEHMYLHQTPYVASGSRAVSETGPYVPKYRKRSRAPAPGICHACGNSDTPEWRRGPDGARTLCNACGLHFAKLVRRRTMEYSNSPPGTMIPPVTLDELRVSSNIGTASDTQHVRAKEESVSEPHSGDSIEQSARSGGLPMQTAASPDRLKDHVDDTHFSPDAVSRDVSSPTGRRSASEKGAAASQLSKHARQDM